MSKLHWFSIFERLPKVGQVVGLEIQEDGRTEQAFGCYDGEGWRDEDNVETLTGYVSAWIPIRTFVCPHCGDNAHPNTLSPEKITMARCQCHHCANEFLIVDDKEVRLSDYL
jgi:hypothetical protein